MPTVDVVDSTWFAVRPTAVAAIVAEPANWRRWWPTLDLAVSEWRGHKGVRWIVRSASGCAAGLAGTAEVWLEPMHEGVVVHFFLRLDPVSNPSTVSRARAERITRKFRVRTKEVFWALGDQLDPGRVDRLTEWRSGSTPGGAP
jgi:hypothetical protein